jgi:hypothetical protein
LTWPTNGAAEAGELLPQQVALARFGRLVLRAGSQVTDTQGLT